MAAQLTRMSLCLLNAGHALRAARIACPQLLTGYVSRHPIGRLSQRWACPRYLTSQPEHETMATEWASPTKDDIHVTDSKPTQSAAMEFTGKKFSEFSLHPDVQSRLQSLGMERTFEIQDKTLPLTLEGRDVIGRAITGSGKTLAFALPIVHILSKSERRYQPRAIVITPTRELCNQVNKAVQSLSNEVRCVSVYGGDSYERQENALRRGVDVVCATPGRLNDHLQRGNFTLEDVQFLVLDEADELLTPGFMEQISNVLADCPPEKQMMLFSATMPPDIKMITKKFMKEPVVVDLVTNRSLVPESVIHEALRVPGYHKRATVADLLLIHKPKRAIVFTSSRADTMEMAKELTAMGIDAEPINSDLTQRARERCLENFRSGRNSVLVATDVAARGIDVPETDMVIQVDPPPSGIDFYIHRSGRTGRKGQFGRSIVVLANDQRRNGFNMHPDDFLRDMKRNKIKLHMIDPPKESEVIKAMTELAGSRLAKIDKETLEVTRPHAQRLLSESDIEGVDAVAAALAVLSNLNVRRLRSMRNARERNQNRRHGDRFSSDRPRRRQNRDYYNDEFKGRNRQRSYGRRHDNYGVQFSDYRGNRPRSYGGKSSNYGDRFSDRSNKQYGDKKNKWSDPEEQW